MSDPKHVIEFRDITKTYKMGENEFQALKGISFVVDKGDMVAIIGPSGSGKSTTMNIIGLLDSATTGTYILNGKDVTSLSNRDRASVRNQEIGFIFQSFFLLPRLTALQNVLLPLLYRGLDKKEASKRAMAMLKRVEMDKHSHHKPSELSGGQQQRVAIARALVGNPSIVLADEPTGALDQKTGEAVMGLLKELNHEEGATVVVITHDIEIANQLPRRIPIVDGVITEKSAWI